MIVPRIPCIIRTSRVKFLTLSSSHCAPVCTTIRSFSSPSTSPYEEDKSRNVFKRTTSAYKLGKHRSNALELVSKQPVIEVDGEMAVCDGGGGALGHPLEYIKLGARMDYGPEGEAAGVPCIYCGLRYRSKGHGH